MSAAAAPPAGTYGPPLFHEDQNFRQPWIMALCLILCAVCAFAALRPELIGRVLRTYPVPDRVLVSLGLFCIGFPFFFFIMRLTTEVRADGVYYRFFPFHRSFRKIPFSGIRHFEAVKYRPIVDYGGWGIRYGLKGKAYNVSGNRGVRFELTEGKPVLLGSQKAEQLARAVEEAMQRI